MSKFMTRASGTLLVLLLLSACSWLPVPYSVDLKSKLGSSSVGEVEHEIGAGVAGDVSFRHPDESGECIDFSDTDIPVTVESAMLHYNATVDYSGPELSGNVTAQLYVANSAGELWLPQNKVGPQVTVNLNNADTRLAGTAVLNRDQVEGINDRFLCWGLEVRGNDVTAQQSGTATIDYNIEELRLATRVSMI